MSENHAHQRQTVSAMHNCDIVPIAILRLFKPCWGRQ